MNTKTVDVTPSWEGLVPVMLQLWSQERAATQTRWDIKQEFIRMAQAADKWNAHCQETR